MYGSYALALLEVSIPLTRRQLFPPKTGMIRSWKGSEVWKWEWLRVGQGGFGSRRVENPTSGNKPGEWYYRHIYCLAINWRVISYDFYYHVANTCDSIIFQHLKIYLINFNHFSTYIWHFYTQFGHNHRPGHYQATNFYVAVYQLRKSYGIPLNEHNSHSIIPFWDGNMLLIPEFKNVIVYDGTKTICFSWWGSGPI